MNITSMPVWQLIEKLESGEITSLMITEAYLDAIASRNEKIHAYVEVFGEEALSEARASDARRKAGEALSVLDGIPIAIKDNISQKGHECACASKMLKGYVAPYDATVTAKIKQAGMPILGRLNMDEFAMGGSTETSAYGVTRNPFDLTCVPGGSSGGSAAAVSAGMAPLALGSDTGGSIRQPSAFCGVFGAKPAYGTVSRYGLVAFASSLDQIGPIAKNARDAALLMEVIAGADAHDATSDRAIDAHFVDRMNAASLDGMVIGMPKECFSKDLKDPVKLSMHLAAENLRSLGATLIEVSIPTLQYALSIYYVLSSAEASSNLARFDGIRYGYRAKAYQDLDELYLKTRQEGFGMEVKRRIMLGTFALSSGYQDQYYFKALKAKALMTQEYSDTLNTCDALLMPVTPTTAYKLGEKSGDPMEMYMGDVFTVPANITGLPAVSVPVSLSEQGLPIAMGLMGGRDALGRLLGIANAYESTFKPLDSLRPYEREEATK